MAPFKGDQLDFRRVDPKTGRAEGTTKEEQEAWEEYRRGNPGPVFKLLGLGPPSEPDAEDAEE